jgi:hypothetical protein
MILQHACAAFCAPMTAGAELHVSSLTAGEASGSMR